MTIQHESLPWVIFVYDALGRLAQEYLSQPQTPPCVTCYLSADYLGTVRLITNESAQVVARHDYLPFGEEVAANMYGRDSTWGDNDPIRQKFTGKERDAESGLDYFGARYYGSGIGRFTSPDWSPNPDAVPYADLRNPQSLNLYVYVLNNPLTSVDPDGHTHQECGADVATWGPGGVTVSTGACHDVPDWWNIWDRFQNWNKKNNDEWIKRIEAHKPPSQARNNENLLTDFNDIMMGMGPVINLSPRFGYKGTQKWIKARNELKASGTHETVAGEVPTRAEATQLINESGGSIQRGAAGEPMDAGEEFGHEPGGVSEHTYPHINYETPSGARQL